MNPKRPLLVSVAGFDPSGGAGVLLDTAVFRARGFRAAAVLTAVTVQNTAGVRRVHALPARLVRDQWRALAEDGPIAGFKVGMSGSAENQRLIVRELARHPGLPKVIDPILRSTSGSSLSGASGFRGFLESLRGGVTLLTPNREEAAALSDRPVRSVRDMETAARIIFETGGAACLVKGGRLPGAAVDVLFDGHRTCLFSRPFLSAGVHGTGCHLSASILGYLAQGRSLPESVRRAAAATHAAMRKAAPAPGGRRRFDF
jgi:hydroxymethylpyrimidine kinase/phosphomethylpyrimidine kinase